MFPFKIPLWFQEVMDGGGADEIKFSNFIDYFKNQQNIKIVLEGIPGGGKTTLLNKVTKKYDFLTIGQYANGVKCINNEDCIENDLLKDNLFKSSKSHITFMDRDFVSTMAYSYAVLREKDSTNNYVTNLYTSLLGEKLFLADIYFYLKVSPDISLRRKDRFKNNMDSEWGNADFLIKMQEYYDNFFNTLKYFTCVIEIDTHNKSLSDVENEVCDVINKLL